MRAAKCKKFVGKLGSQWALRRAFEWKKFVGQLSQWTLIRATDCTKFVGWLGS